MQTLPAIIPTFDSTIDENNPNDTGLLGDSLLSVNALIPNRKRALMDFDLSSFKRVAETITRAELAITQIGGTFTFRVISIRRLLNRMTIDEATWNNRSTATAWDTPGGDFTSVNEIAFLATPASPTEVVDITGMVKDAVAAGDQSLQIIVMQDAFAPLTVYEIGAANRSPASERPSLEITFIPNRSRERSRFR